MDTGTRLGAMHLRFFAKQGPGTTKGKRVPVYFALFSAGLIIFIAAMVRYQFVFMRYHFEYYFQAAKWHLNVECAAPFSEPPTKGDIYPDADWQELISKQLKKIPDRWVVSKHHVGFGLCNRILNSVSALLLAMATNRTLWIEWERQEAVYITSNEFAGMSSYDDLFESPFHDIRFRPPSELIENATKVQDCFMEKLRFSSDLNKEYDHKVIRIDKGEWWGGLLFHNRAYSQTVFKGLKPMEGFPILFRAMFSLRPPHVKPEKCSWMIQYRTIWPPPRYTAPIESFLACAVEKGMTPEDYHTTWIVADDPAAMIAHASPAARRVLSTMNLPADNVTCRGPCGDRQAMETMYRLSRCRNAVLTLGSSFGSCISSLAGAPRQYRVSHYGECLPMSAAEGPVDINTYSRNGNIATYLSQLPD